MLCSMAAGLPGGAAARVGIPLHQGAMQVGQRARMQVAQRKIVVSRAVVLRADLCHLDADLADQVDELAIDRQRRIVGQLLEQEGGFFDAFGVFAFVEAQLRQRHFAVADIKTGLVVKQALLVGFQMQSAHLDEAAKLILDLQTGRVGLQRVALHMAAEIDHHPDAAPACPAVFAFFCFRQVEGNGRTACRADAAAQETEFTMDLQRLLLAEQCRSLLLLFGSKHQFAVGDSGGQRREAGEWAMRELGAQRDPDWFGGRGFSTVGAIACLGQGGQFVNADQFDGGNFRRGKNAALEVAADQFDVRLLVEGAILFVGAWLRRAFPRNQALAG